MSLNGPVHETATIKAFVVPGRRERFLNLITNPKRRKKFLNELAHFRYLDARYALPIAPRDRNPIAILGLLRAKGAGINCWVISEWDRLDGRELSLESVLRDVVGGQMGTFVSCIPGRLGYFEDEDGRFILER